MTDTRLAKAHLELIMTAVRIAIKPQILNDPDNITKLTAALEEYQSALNAWAGFEMEKEPIIAEPPKVVGPVIHTLAPPAINPFDEKPLLDYRGIGK